MERLIIDTDPGVDDAHAIMMALAHPQIEVEALTVVAGNVGLERTVANACTILDIMEADVPVFAGCQHPLVLAAEDAAEVHGSDGLGNANYPPSPRPVEAEHASIALVRLANESPGELTLVAIGPLTNLAVALKLDPQLPHKYRRLVVMGGAVNGRGNAGTITSEFNIYTDPEAAHVVFEAWPQLSLVSWEATMDHTIPADTVAGWLQLETPRARFFRRVTTELLNFIEQILGQPFLFVPDGLTMAVAIEPSIVTRSERHHTTVEINGTYTRGQTTVDWQDRGGNAPNVDVIQEVDSQRLTELLEMALR